MQKDPSTVVRGTKTYDGMYSCARRRVTDSTAGFLTKVGKQLNRTAPFADIPCCDHSTAIPF
jgi:hypothetical protein